MTRKRFTTLSAVLGTLLSLTLANSARAQSVDGLLDKLVDKGILSVKEANDLKQETDKGFTAALQTRNGMPDWVTALKFNGDFRGRYEWISPNTVAIPENIDRYRFRYRLRFGAVATIKDDFEVGFRLTSSEPAKGFSDASKSPGGDPISGNTSFSGNGSKKFIYIDQAYGKWSPLHADGWNGSLTIGKMENPFTFSDIVFDQDYTPEGAAAQISYAFNDVHTLKLAGSGFMLKELDASSGDPYLLGAQLRLDSKWSPKLSSSVGIAALSLDNAGNLITAAVPNQNVGNTRKAVPGGDFSLVYNFNPVVADASLTYTLDSFPFYSGAFPIRAFCDYMNNPGAPSDRNTGWSAGVTFGKSGKKGLWDITYRYKHLESDAWYEEMVDSDTGAFYPEAPVGGAAGYGAGTNLKGHVLKATYSPFDSLTLGATFFLLDLINNPSPSFSSQAKRLQVDAIWKF
jgi:hypothetical protein